MLCHCGQPLHYEDPELQRAVEDIIQALGEYILVKAGGRAWRVNRHYIALHGLKAAELPFLGLEEVTE